MRMPRYGPGAWAYDWLSAEVPVYRVARRQALDALSLRAGQHVLDLAGGTGLNVPYLLDAVGPDGRVTLLDASEPMLAHAARRFADDDRVDLIHADARDLRSHVTSVDAAVATYALSIIDSWQQVADDLVAVVGAGGRLAVVDLDLPHGLGRLLSPAARLAIATGGADVSRRPWQLVEACCDDVRRGAAWWGHTVWAVGTIRSAHRPPADQEER